MCAYALRRWRPWLFAIGAAAAVAAGWSLVVLGYLNRRALGDFTALRRRVGIELSLLVTLTAAVSLLTDLPPANSTPANAGGKAAITRTGDR
jgi:hypothetical protein